MSLTIVKDVVEYNPVRNPARFGVKSSVFDAGTPVAPYLSIFIDDADRPGDGDTMTLTSVALGGSIEFTFLTSPGDEPDELPAYTSGTTVDYVIALAAALQAKYLINLNYQVLPVNVGPVYGILIIARNLSPTPGEAEYSTDQDLTWSKTGWTEASEATVNANSFSLPANAAIIFQVHADYDYPNGDNRIVLEDEYPPDSVGRAYIDASQAVRSLLRPQWPAVAATSSYTAFTAMTKYFIRACERYGDPPVDKPMLTSSSVFGYLAGRNEGQRSLLPSYEDQVIGLSTNIKFLSNWPNTTSTSPKLITPDQDEYVTWIFPSDRGTTFVLRADIYYETGADTTLHTIETFSSRFNELLVCPIGVIARSLDDLDPTRRIRAFRIYLTTSGTSLRSEYRYYEVDHRYHEWTTPMLFWSPSGALDTILLHGAKQGTGDVRRVVSARTVVDPTTPAAASDSEVITSASDKEAQQGTCYLREQELAMLTDLAASESVRAIIDGTFYPVVLTETEFDLEQQGEGLAARSVSYRIAHLNRAN